MEKKKKRILVILEYICNHGDFSVVVSVYVYDICESHRRGETTEVESIKMLQDIRMEGRTQQQRAVDIAVFKKDTKTWI